MALTIPMTISLQRSTANCGASIGLVWMVIMIISAVYPASPGIGVFDLNQRRNPGTKPGPQTADQHHQQRRADHQDDDNQRRNTANKGPGNTQHTAIADRAGVRFAASSKGRPGGDDRCRQYRPARRFELKMETDKQRQHHRACKLNGKAEMPGSNGICPHSD